MAIGERSTRVEYTEQPVEPPVIAQEDRVTVARDVAGERRMGAARAVQAVTLIFGVVIALVAIRFVLLALGANPDAGFTSFVYGFTGPLVAPFEGIFGAADTSTGVIDPASLVAIVVYALVSWVVARLVWLALGDTRSEHRTTEHRVEDLR